MPSLTGALNATGVLLHMFDPDAGAAGEWVIIGGQMVNDHTLNTALIDMTNKDSLSFQEFLEEQGRQDLNDSATIVFNTGASFAALQTAARTKAIRRFIWARGDLETGPGSDMFSGIVATFNDSASNEALVTAVVNIVSANDDVLFFAILFNDAIDSNADDAIDAAGNAALARA